MTTSLSFRLSAACVLLILPVLTSGGRCFGQEARRPADLRAGKRVLAASVRAALVLLRDPDDAYALLKTVRDAIRDDPGISEPCRERLESRLEWALEGVVTSGRFIKELHYEGLAVKAEFRAQLARLRFPGKQ
jgi:hypothetical protein